MHNEWISAEKNIIYARLWRTQLSGPAANSKRVDTVRNERNEIISCLTQFDLMAFISLMLRAARLFYHLLLLLLLYIIAGSIDRWGGRAIGDTENCYRLYLSWLLFKERRKV